MSTLAFELASAPSPAGVTSGEDGALELAKVFNPPDDPGAVEALPANANGLCSSAMSNPQSRWVAKERVVNTLSGASSASRARCKQACQTSKSTKR